MFGLFGLPQGVTQGAATLAMQKPQEAPRKPGFSEPGGLGEKLALLGGAISNLGGRRNPLADLAMQQMMQRQQMQAQSQREQAQAEAENRQWYERKQWERDNPMPTRNDTIEDFNWYKGLSPEDRKTYQEMRPVYRQGPDGQFYRVDASQGQDLGAELPQGWQMDGGPAPGAPGGFPRYR